MALIIFQKNYMDIQKLTAILKSCHSLLKIFIDMTKMSKCAKRQYVEKIDQYLPESMHF